VVQIIKKRRTTMKNLFFTLALMVACLYSTATIFTVNNNLPSPGQYNVLQLAVNAASNGDTLYISGSPYNYNTITINKRLTLIGTGHKPQNQNTSVSKIENIYLASGSNRTRIIGCEVNYIAPTTVNIDSIQIERCKITAYVQINQSNCDNWHILGNVFTYVGTNIWHANNSGLHHMYYRNNIFSGQLKDLEYFSGNYEIYITNNLFTYTGNLFADNNYYLNIYNNIFYGSNTTPSTTSCTWQNNLSFGGTTNTFPSGTINLTNTNPLFTTAPVPPLTFSYTHNYTFASGSPCINYGTDGTNIGHLGGNYYFENFGIPAIPQMRSVSISNPTVPAGGTLNVNIISTIKQ
jgi:hypothetical protein